MFNLLTDELPTTVTIDDVSYRINADIRTILKIIILAEDSTITTKESELEDIVLQQLALFYEDMPNDVTKAFTAMVDFYAYPLTSYGEKSNQSTDTTSTTKKSTQKNYSFKYDSALIFSSMKREYPQVDLKTLHWYEFQSLLEGLSEESLFAKVCYYRTVVINSKLSKSEKAFYRKMKHKYKLPAEKGDGVNSSFDGYIQNSSHL